MKIYGLILITAFSTTTHAGSDFFTLEDDPPSIAVINDDSAVVLPDKAPTPASFVGPKAVVTKAVASDTVATKTIITKVTTAKADRPKAAPPKRQENFPKCGSGSTDSPAVAARMLEQILHLTNASSTRIKGKNVENKNVVLSIETATDLQMRVEMDGQVNSRATTLCQKGNTIVANIESGYSFPLPKSGDFILTPISTDRIHISGYKVDNNFSASAR